MISLRSNITQKVLSYFFLHPKSELYINEMVQLLNVDCGNLVRKLQELEKEGLLRSEWKGNQKYYSLNQSYPLIKEYKKIFLKTAGVEYELKKVLSEVKNIQEAYIYNCSPRDKRELKKIIYQHFDYIVSEWDKFKEAGNE